MFIETTDDVLVNTDHVVKAIWREAPKSCTGGVYRLINARGEVLGEIYENQKNELQNPPAVIPSWPGTKGVIVTVWGNDEKGWETSAEECDIVAWRTDPQRPRHAHPIAATDICSNQVLLIRTPDGAIEDPGEYTFQTVEEAKAHYLDWEKKKAQWAAEREAKKKAAS